MKTDLGLYLGADNSASLVLYTAGINNPDGYVILPIVKDHRCDDTDLYPDANFMDRSWSPAGSWIPPLNGLVVWVWVEDTVDFHFIPLPDITPEEQRLCAPLRNTKSLHKLRRLPLEALRHFQAVLDVGDPVQERVSQEFQRLKAAGIVRWHEARRGDSPASEEPSNEAA
jgi:hypothetical protein